MHFGSCGKYDEKTHRGAACPEREVCVGYSNSELLPGSVFFRVVIGHGRVYERTCARITRRGTIESSFYPRPQIHVAGDNAYLLWEDRATHDCNDQMFFANGVD